MGVLRVSRIVLFAGFFLLGSASYTPAADPFVLVTSGAKYLVVETDDQIKIYKLSGLREVSWPGSGAPPTDPDGPDPEPDDDDLVNDVNDWAGEVGSPLDSQKWAMIFKLVRDAFSDGEIGFDDIFEIISVLADEFFGDDWSPFRSRLTDWTTRARQDGRIGQRVSTMNFLARVRRGLELSATGSNSLPQAEKDRIELRVAQEIARVKSGR